MNDDGFMPGVILASVVWMLLVWFFLSQTNDSWRKQIIEHGAAEAYFDANHDPQWRWQPCGPKVEVK